MGWQGPGASLWCRCLAYAEDNSSILQAKLELRHLHLPRKGALKCWFLTWRATKELCLLSRSLSAKQLLHPPPPPPQQRLSWQGTACGPSKSRWRCRRRPGSTSITAGSGGAPAQSRIGSQCHISNMTAPEGPGFFACVSAHAEEL